MTGEGVAGIAILNGGGGGFNSPGKQPNTRSETSLTSIRPTSHAASNLNQ